MGDPRGFIKLRREEAPYRPVCERMKDFRHVALEKPVRQSEEQASRCMDCGTPFCHWGCPLGNYIPEWNDLVYHGHWGRAFELLEATNCLPEVTGRICPAPCEYACVLGINDDPVTIRENELAIVEYAFKKGMVVPRPPAERTGKSVAIVGSGPAGLSCAADLNRAGHRVTVFERDSLPGGIMRYGIPDFKLEKWVLDRRIDIWRREGVEFRCGIDAGADYPVSKLTREFDAVALCGGSRVPRDIKIEGRELSGIHFAMDYLIRSNEDTLGIGAKGKKVVVIGGGDTGADCVGMAHRQGAQCVVQIEILDKPPGCRTEDHPWPIYPMILRTSTSHEEGGERRWSVLTKKFMGDEGRLKGLICGKLESCKEVPGGEFVIEADLAIIAAGFLHPEHNGLLEELGVEFDAKGNVKTGADFMTSKKGIFSAGDMRRGQSLVVWALAEGSKTARAVDTYLMGRERW